MKEKVHYYNLDMCRIVAMFEILSLHIMLGGLLENTQLGSANFWIAWFIEICCFGSVNLFAMLSGFLGYQKMQQKTFRLIELLLIVCFYSVVITIGFLIFKPEVFDGAKGIIFSLVPALKGRLWYITCYIPLFIFQPYINHLLNILDLNQHKKLCIISNILLGVIPCVLKTDLFKTDNGYSFLWLLVCYISGAYLKRTEIKIHTSVAWLIFLGGGIGQLAVKWGSYIIRHNNSYYMLNYQSPFIIFMAIATLMMFNNLKIKQIKVMKLVTILSGCAFDVYIIHCHPTFYDILLDGIFSKIATFPSFLLVLTWAGCVVGLYIFFSVVGLLRQGLFRFVHLDIFIKKCSEEIDLILKL